MKPAHPLDRPGHDSPHNRGALRTRFAVLLAVLAIPAMAMASDFGALPGNAPIESESVARELAAMPAMPFERPGQTFPGSAFFYLADPLDEGLIEMPSADPFGSGTDAGRELGQLIDVGPAARPLFSSASSTSHARALECLAQAVWYEAASEGEAGQRAVAQVVLNRVAHPNWPNSVCGVVYQGSERSTGCQFSFTCDGSLARKASGASWRRAQVIASAALSGSVYAPIGHATHYHTLWVNPVWASSLDHIGTIGAHRFYRNRGAGGEKTAFSGRYSGFEPGVSGRMHPAPAPIRSEPGIDFTVRSVPAPLAAPQPAKATKPAPAPATPAFGNVGQVKQQYSQAGQWKQQPAPGTGTAPGGSSEQP